MSNYECIRAYLSQNNYAGTVASQREGMYTMTENVIRDGLPNLMLITKLFGTERVDKSVGLSCVDPSNFERNLDIRALVYEPSLAASGKSFRAFHVARTRSSIQNKATRGTTEQVNVLLASEIPAGSYSTSVFKDENRIISYGEIEIDKSKDYVCEAPTGYLEERDVNWDNVKRKADKSSVELLKALMTAKAHGQSAFLVYAPSDFEIAEQQIFSVIESFPVNIANEISFNTCCTDAIFSATHFDISGIPTKDASYIDQLCERGAVVMLGEAYKGDSESSYIRLLTSASEEKIAEFKSSYLPRCKTMSDIDEYAELCMSLAPSIELEENKKRMKVILDFINKRLDLGELDSELKSDTFNALFDKLELAISLEDSASDLYNDNISNIISLYKRIKNQDASSASRLMSYACKIITRDIGGMLSNQESIRAKLGSCYNAFLTELDKVEKLDEQLIRSVKISACDERAYTETVFPIICFYRSIENKDSSSARVMIKHVARLIFAKDASFFINNFTEIESDMGKAYTYFLNVIEGSWRELGIADKLCAVTRAQASDEEKLFNELISPTLQLHHSLASKAAPLAGYIRECICKQTFRENARVLFAHIDDYDEVIDYILRIASEQWSGYSRIFDATFNSISAPTACNKITKRLLLNSDLSNSEIARFFIAKNLRYNDPYETIMLFYNETELKNSIERIMGIVHTVEEDATTSKKVLGALLKLIKGSQEEYINNYRVMDFEVMPISVAAKIFYKERENEKYARLFHELTPELVEAIRRAQKLWYRNSYENSSQSPLRRALTELYSHSEDKSCNDMFNELFNDVVGLVFNSQEKWRERGEIGGFSASPLAKALTALFKRRESSPYRTTLDYVTELLPKELEAEHDKWSERSKKESESPIVRTISELYKGVDDKYCQKLLLRLIGSLANVTKRTARSRYHLVESLESIILKSNPAADAEHANMVRKELVKMALTADALKNISCDETSLDDCERHIEWLSDLNAKTRKIYSDFVEWYKGLSTTLKEKNRVRRLKEVRYAEISTYISQIPRTELFLMMEKNIKSHNNELRKLEQSSNDNNNKYEKYKGISDRYSSNEFYEKYVLYKLTGTSGGEDQDREFIEIVGDAPDFPTRDDDNTSEAVRAMEAYLNKRNESDLGKLIAVKAQTALLPAAIGAILMFVLAALVLPSIYNGFFDSSKMLAFVLIAVVGVIFTVCSWINLSRRAKWERILITAIWTVVVSLAVVLIFFGVHWLVSTII